jgi:hypothetical protein
MKNGRIGGRKMGNERARKRDLPGAGQNRIIVEKWKTMRLGV